MLRYFCLIKRSTIAFITALVLAVLSLGALGAALFFLVSPVLPVDSGNVDHLSGDWVWPAMILAGLAWSPAFLVAGALHHRLAPGIPRAVLRALIYGATLWLAAALVWWLILLYAPHHF